MGKTKAKARPAARAEGTRGPAAGDGEAGRPAAPPGPDGRRYRRAADLLHLAADATRLSILLMLRDDSVNVTDICREMTSGQPAVSHHLALLRHGGIVEANREGKCSYYALTGGGRELADRVAAAIDLGLGQ